MITRHLDIGCGPCPRNPFNCDEVYAVDLALPAGIDNSKFVQANLNLEPLPTPAYPSPEAFQDPTHVNIITEGSWRHFCGDLPAARMYGFKGDFELQRNERALHPEAFKPMEPISWWRQHRRRRLLRTGRLSHLLWEFVCVKQSS